MKKHVKTFENYNQINENLDIIQLSYEQIEGREGTQMMFFETFNGFRFGIDKRYIEHSGHIEIKLPTGQVINTEDIEGLTHWDDE